MHKYDVYTKLKYIFIRTCGIVKTNGQNKIKNN